MKTIFNSRHLKTLSLALTSILTSSMFLTSCSKKTASSNPQAFIKVTDAADGSVSQDFYLDNKKVNNEAVEYGQTMGFTAVSTGTRQADFRNAGSSSVNTSFSLPLQPGGYYDIFYTDGNSNASYTDDRTIPQMGKARVRFINLSSALTSNIDVAASPGGKFITALAFKSASPYSDIDPTQPVLIYSSGSSTALINIAAGTIPLNHICTVYISGSTMAHIAFNIIQEN